MIAPKAIIFDLDGTLIEFPREYIFLQAERILPLLEHPEVAREILEEHFSLFDFFGFVRTDIRESFVSKFWKEFDWPNYPKPVSFSFTSSTLELIAARNIPMAIATARLEPEHSIRSVLEPTGWLHHFSCVTARDAGTENWMDKTAQILAVCRALGVEPKDTLVIGDVPSDILSGKAVGAGTTAGVLSGGIKRSVLEKAEPDFLLDGIHDLVRLLETR